MAADLAIAATHSGPPPGLAGLLFVCSSVHVAATAGLFGFADVRRHAATHRARYVYAPVALVVGGALLAAALSPHDLSVILLGYFGWQLLHYQKQNLGLAALATTASASPRLSGTERRAITATALAGSVALVLRPQVLQLGLSDPTAAWSGVAREAALGGYLIAIGVGIASLLGRSTKDRRRTLVSLYLLALLFPAPIFVFSSPYLAIGLLTIVHGVQYLLITAMVVGGPNQVGRATRLAGFAALALALGLGLNLASHLHNGGVIARAGFGGYLGLVMTHFVVDGGLWRLRDPFPRSFVGRRLPRFVPATRPMEA